MSVLYGARGSSLTTSNLYSINPATGGTTSIGAIGFALTGLAFDPTSGTLYGITSNNSASNPRSLISVNPVTGVGTLIGSLGLASPTSDIAFDSAGVLYGLGGPSFTNLYTINLSTGAASDLGDANTGGSGNAIDFGDDDSILLAFPNGGNSGDSYVEIYVSTVSTCTIGTLSGSPLSPSAVAAGSFGPDGLFYAIITSGPSGSTHLVTINPATGVVTDIGATTQNRFDAIAWDTQVRPTLPVCVAPPANDDLADATALTSATPCAQTLAGTTAGATAQVGENDPFPGVSPSHSVWYTLGTTCGLRCRIWLTSSDPNMVDGLMSVYPGAMSFGDTAICQSDDDLGLQPECFVEGETFVTIQIDTRDTGGAFTIHWQVVDSPGAPANDDFADAEVFSGSSGTTSGDTADASYECGEDPETFGTNPLSRTVWYKRVQVVSELVELTFDDGGSAFLLVDVFSGTTLGSLTPVADTLLDSGGSSDTILFAAVAGETYYVRVNGGSSCVEHSFTMDWDVCSSTPPAEDDFADAGTIADTGLTNVVQAVACSTLEPSEQNPDGFLGSAWQKLTVTHSAKVAFHKNSGPTTGLGGGGIHVWKGTVLSSLQEVGNATIVGGSGDKTLYLAAGTYYFQFGMHELSPVDWDVNFTVTQAREVASADVSVGSVGDFTDIDLGSDRLGRGGWFRMVVTRDGGDFVHRGTCSPDLDPSNTEIVKLAVLLDDSDVELGYIGLHGRQNGMNEIVHTLDGTGYVLLDGVQVGEGSDRFMGSLVRSQDVLVAEIHTSLSPAKTLRIGMPAGPSCLDDGGWALTFSEIAYTDDPALGPYGSPDSADRDAGYAAAWTNVDCVLPAVGALPAISDTPPGSLGQDSGLEFTPTSGGVMGIEVPLPGQQPLSGVSFSIVISEALDASSTLVAFDGSGGVGGIVLDPDGTLTVSGQSGGLATAGVLSLDTLYAIEVSVDVSNPDDERITCRVNGAPTTVDCRRNVTAPLSMSQTVHVGVLDGASAGEIYIGPLVTGRTRKSIPLGQVLFEKLLVDGVGTHLLPTSAAIDVAHTFAVDEESIIGTALNLSSWTGVHGGGGAVRSGENIGGSLVGDLGVSGNPTGSATVTVHAAASEGWLKMNAGFLWPQASGSLFFDFYVTGPSGKTISIADIGQAGKLYSATPVGVTCDGTRQHVFGWSDPNFLTTWVDASDTATFNIHLPGGTGDQIYTIDTFQAWVEPTIEPTYGLSSASGSSPSQITSGDTSSDAALNDGDDSTVILLDRKGTFTLVAPLGDVRATPIVKSFFQEVTQYAQRSYLEYTLDDPSIAPAIVKLVARTGGWRYFDTSRVSARSRFGIDVGGAEKSIGGITNSVIADGELVIPGPPIPTSAWTLSDLQALRLRVGYYDGQAEEAFGYHAYGNGPTELFDEPETGGLVAQAHLEVFRLVPANFILVSFSGLSMPRRSRPTHRG